MLLSGKLFLFSPSCNDAEQNDSALELRRTTLCVFNMTRSLEFYEHGLGMVKFYENIIKDPYDAETIEVAEKWRSLVFLRLIVEFIFVLKIFLN